MKRSRYLTAALLASMTAACSCGDEGETPDAGVCTKKEDCPEGQLCAMDGRCVAGECVRDDDCVAKDPRKQCKLDTNTCAFREGFADDCGPGRPCAFGQFCSTLLGRCLESAASRDCTRRAQCPAQQICDREVNKCVADLGCFGDTFCETGELCDLVNHACRSIAVECTRCGSEQSCEGGALCHTDTKECVAGGAEPACRAGEQCDPLGRCVQCTNSDQCGPGTYCNVALGRCESNVQCADDPSHCPTTMNVQCVICQSPEICDPRTKQCQAPPTECENDTDCPGDQFCDIGRDPPICVARVPDCLDDLLGEPNGTAAQAALLDPMRGPLYDELKLCPNDGDWYRLDVAAGTYLVIDARFRHVQDGDIDVQLFLADGRTLVDESRSITDNERVELEVGTDLSLLLRVFHAVPTLRPAPYRLVVSRDTGLLCPDDAHEPDDALSSAKPITTDRPTDGRVCPADPDWFVLQGVPAGSRVSVHLMFRASLGDLDLELVRPDSPAPLLSSTGIDDGEMITFDAPFGGDFYLRVFGKAGDGNVYTLRTDVRPMAGPGCLDDRFEPNDVPARAIDAPDVTGEAATDLTLCAGDEDWFKINLGPGEALGAEVGFDPAADLDLKLYAPGSDASSPPLKSSGGSSLREFLAYRTVRAGDYLLRVHSLRPSVATRYDLRIERMPPLICEDDAIDAMNIGDSQVEASPLMPSPTRVDDLTICSGDEDWFIALLQAPFTNVIRIHYLEADASLDLGVYDGTGALLIATQGPGDTKEVAVNVNGAGFAPVYVRVFRGGGFESAYSLTVDTIPLFECLEDAFEPNDELAMSSTTSTTGATLLDYPDLTLCAGDRNILTGVGDEDWFRIRPPAPGSRIDARIEHDRGDLFLELYSPLGVKRACFNLGPDRCYSDGFGMSENVSFTATVAADYFLRVGSIYGSPAVQVTPRDANTGYRLHVELIEP